MRPKGRLEIVLTGSLEVLITFVRACKLYYFPILSGARYINSKFFMRKNYLKLMAFSLSISSLMNSLLSSLRVGSVPGLKWTWLSIRWRKNQSERFNNSSLPSPLPSWCATFWDEE